MPGRTDAQVAKIIERGRDAHQDFELVKDKIAEFKREIHAAFEKTTTMQEVERHNLWQALQIANKVVEYLTTDISSGKNAIKYLDEIKKVGKPSLVERILP